MQTSVSQIENFEGCPSNWAYGAVHGIWVNKNRFADDGITVHEHIENYSKYGQKFDGSHLGKLAKLASPWLPDPADSPLIEKGMLLVYDGFTFKMSSDGAWEAPNGAVMNDYKSVNHYRYALTAQRLRSNLQACVYSLKLIQLWGVDQVTCRWVYLRRPPVDAPEDWEPGPDDIKVVQAVIDEDDARAVLRSKKETLDKMLNIKKRSLPMSDIERNEQHCKAYGGCGYRGHCFPDKFDQKTGKPLE